MADQEARFIQLTTDLLNKFDANKDGSLSKEEFGACMISVNGGVPQEMIDGAQEMIDKFFAEIDLNSDDRISIEELQKSMRPQIIDACETEEGYAEIRASMGL